MMDFSNFTLRRIILGDIFWSCVRAVRKAGNSPQGAGSSAGVSLHFSRKEFRWWFINTLSFACIPELSLKCTGSKLLSQILAMWPWRCSRDKRRFGQRPSKWRENPLRDGVGWGGTRQCYVSFHRPLSRPFRSHCLLSFPIFVSSSKLYSTHCAVYFIFLVPRCWTQNARLISIYNFTLLWNFTYS